MFDGLRTEGLVAPLLLWTPWICGLMMVPMKLPGIFRGADIALINNIDIGVLLCHDNCCTQITFPHLLSALPKYVFLSQSSTSVLVGMGLVHVQVLHVRQTIFPTIYFFFSPLTWIYSHSINIMTPFVQCDAKEFQGLEFLLRKLGKIFLSTGIYFP